MASSTKPPAARTLSEAAAQRLEKGVGDSAMQRLWLQATLRCLTTGEICTPDRLALKAETEPTLYWPKHLGLSAELLQEQIARLRDCHLLAIADNDNLWLQQLAHCWQQAPEELCGNWPLLARGELALADVRIEPWNAEELECLQADYLLQTKAPASRAWLALHRGSHAAARQAINDYQACLTTTMAGWQHAGAAGLPAALAQSTAVLTLELRALQVLAARQ